MVENVNNASNTFLNTPEIQKPKGIELARKGDFAYNKQMDLDDDGVITSDELDDYCEMNGVSDKDKIKLMQTMMSAKLMQELMQKRQEEQEKEKIEKQEDKKAEEESQKEEDEKTEPTLEDVINETINRKTALKNYQNS